MQYRRLGRTGVQVSMLCLGCARLGTTSDADESMDLIDRALDLGINFIDTANKYGPSEGIVGQALARNGKRDQVILATKVGSTAGGEELNSRGGSRRHVIEQCHQSLRRLQTDWIDLYQIHLPSPQIPIDETLQALDDLIRAGKVRYIGGSNFAAWQYVEALWAAHDLGLNRFISEQPAYNLLDRGTELELVPCALTYGLAINPYSPLAEGVLAGKYQRSEVPSPGSRFGAADARLAEHLTEPVFAALDVVAAIASGKGCTMSQLSLAWCARQPGITSPVIGPRTREQLEDNVGAAEVMVTDEDCAQLDEVAPPYGTLVQYRNQYASYFGPHTHRW